MSSAGGVSPWASQGKRVGRLAALVVGRAMFQAEAGLSTLYLIVSLGVASLTAGFVYLSGAAISAIPAAVAGGPGSPDLGRVLTIVLGMAGLFLLQQVCVTVQSMLSAVLGHRVEGDLRTRLFRALARPRRIDHLNDPEISAKVAAASTVGTARYGVSAALGFGTPAFNAFLFGLWMAGLVAAFSWWLALLLLVLSLGVRLLVHREALYYWAAIGFQTTGSQRAVYFRDLGLTPAAAKEIRIFGLADWIVGRFRAHWSEAARTDAAKRASVHASLWLAVPILVVNGLAFALLVAALRAGSIDLHQFAITAQALVGISILGVSWRDEVAITWGAATVPSVWEVEALLGESPAPSRPAPSPQHALSFERVTFRYPGGESPVLDALDLEIPVGRSTAIVGVNGAGKTTLIKLLCGLISPDSGQISLDGQSLSDVDPDEWRRTIAVLFQDFVHYPFSAADNVLFGAFDHTPKPGDLDRIGRQVGLAELVDTLPDGWNTVLSKQYTGGRDLSGGQWQRVALARSLWAVEAGARILVLDEPTANLDVRAEARFYEQFLDLSRGLTTILISHRFASVRRADNIVVIADGRVVESGDHQTLMRGDTRYARMFAAQTDDFAREAGDA